MPRSASSAVCGGTRRCSSSIRPRASSARTRTSIAASRPLQRLGRLLAGEHRQEAQPGRQQVRVALGDLPQRRVSRPRNAVSPSAVSR